MNVSEIIKACDWFPSYFGVISQNVFSPLLYYSYLGTLIPTLLIGVFVLLQGKKQLANRLLFLTSSLFAVWVFGALILWATEFPRFTMFFWSLINLIEPFIYFFAFYFAYVFIREQDLSLRQKIFFSIPLLPTIILAPTKFMLLGYDLSNCDRNAYEGIASSYGYFVEIIYVLSILFFSFSTKKNKENRKKINLLTIGIVAFLLSFSLGNILEVFTENWYIGQYGLFGAPIFAGFLAYLIIRYKALNAKLFGAQALVTSLTIVIGSILFVRDIHNIRFVLIPSLLLVLVMGYYLIRSVKREVEQREYLEKISKELSSANDQLRVLDKQKSEFLSFASHDLKSPIALIKQFATLIYDGTYKEPAKVHETVLKIKNTADRAVNMVNTFLDLRKIEEGRMEYNFEKKNIVEFVSGITADFALLAKQQKNLDVLFSSATPDIQVTLDTNTLRQVIQNFLDNSMKYTEAGWIKVEITNEQKTVLIKVSDSGLGMSKELLPILFGQFHRDPGTAKKIQGTGLGLYIAKQIVLAHHGDTWAESEGPGKGSQFYIRLPKA